MKSFFAISTLAGVAGLAAVCAGAGCANDTVESDPLATEPDVDAGKKPQRQPPPQTSSDDGDGGAPTTESPMLACMSTEPFDATQVPYHPPAVSPGSCTPADIEAFQTYVDAHPQATFDDVKATMDGRSPRCSDCVFGDPDDDKWAPIVFDERGGLFNGGGCVAVVSGKDACGEGYQQWNTCLNSVCSSCTDKGENATCKNDAQQPSGPCGAASQALWDGCGQNVNSYLEKCFGDGIGEVLQQLCGSPATDGGV